MTEVEKNKINKFLQTNKFLTKEQIKDFLQDTLMLSLTFPVYRISHFVEELRFFAPEKISKINFFKIEEDNILAIIFLIKPSFETYIIETTQSQFDTLEFYSNDARFLLEFGELLSKD
jgi:hypothetical protein